MDTFVPACRWIEEQFIFENEVIWFDEDWNIEISLVADEECDTCRLKTECVRRALFIMSVWDMDAIKDLKITWAMTTN